jgi:hypothetical protein
MTEIKKGKVRGDVMSDNKFITGKEKILWLMVCRQYLHIALVKRWLEAR